MSASSSARQRVVITELNVYPVKSCGRITLKSAQLDIGGLVHDRAFLIVNDKNAFVTQRTHPQLARVRPTFSADGSAMQLAFDDAAPLDVPLGAAAYAGRDAVRVRVWKSECDGVPVGAHADAWVTHVLGEPARLVYCPQQQREVEACGPLQPAADARVAFADYAPLLVTTEESLAAVNAGIGGAGVPMARFRPNIVVRGASAAFDEERWGLVDVRASSSAAAAAAADASSDARAVLRAAALSTRCKLTTVDQELGVVTSTQPLAFLREKHYSADYKGAIFGMMMTVAEMGVIRVGDELIVRERLAEAGGAHLAQPAAETKSEAQADAAPWKSPAVRVIALAGLAVAVGVFFARQIASSSAQSGSS